MNKNINIMQLEAKDVISGVEIKSFARYKASFDYSLESIHMADIYKKVYRNNRFTFIHDDKLYSDVVISISFKYNTKDYSTSALRKHLYDNGFVCNGNRYVRYKRSSGSSRVGKCLFILEDLFLPMMKWSYNGLYYRPDETMDLASMEAYLSLPMSSIISTLQIKPENILLIDDYESVFKDTVMATRVKSVGDKKHRLHTNVEEIDISNNIWDGQSLMDTSLFSHKYKHKGMLLLRNRFFKSCCFHTNIQQFFIDNNITDISQLNGKTLATDITDIKLITTPSSIKYLKYNTFEQWLENLDHTFGVVKFDKQPHFFNGEMVQTHYQLLNTLELSYKETESLLQDSLEYVRLLKTDLSVLRFQLKMNIDRDLDINDISTTNNFVYTMLNINDKIQNTNMFYEFRKELINSYIDQLRRGRVLIDGNYSTLMGNGYEMLLASVGKFNGDSVLTGDEIISYRFEPDQELLAVRSPHITMGNIWIAKNVRKTEYEEYFNLSKQILCINTINNNVLHKLNGSDFDSDTCLITNDSLLVRKAKEYNGKFLVPTSMVESKKINRQNNAWHRYDLDQKTSVNKIGEIVNLSQILNSHLWELKKQHKDYSKVYKDICQLAIMSCIEIDKAKKEFSIDNEHELKLLRKRYAEFIQIKPMFFYHLPVDSSLKIDRDIKKYRNYETTMDYLEVIINEFVKRNRVKREPRLTLAELISNNNYMKSNANYRHSKSIIKKCEIYRNENALIWLNEVATKQEKYFESLELKDSFIKELSNIDITPETIRKIIEDVDTKLQRKILVALFTAHKDKVVDLLSSGMETVSTLKKLKPCDDYEDVIYLYQKPYKNLQKMANFAELGFETVEISTQNDPNLWA